MIDAKLIQNEDGDVWYFVGDIPPAGWIWMPPAVGPGMRVLGTWRVDVGQPAETQEREICVGKKKVRCAVFSRVVGFLTPVGNWNKGKRQEFKERATYNVEKAIEKCQSPPNLSP